MGLEQALDCVERCFPDRPLVVASCLAEGADRLVARCVLDRPRSGLVAVLPLPVQDYLEDFATEASRTDFLELLRLADRVVDPHPTRLRDEAYRRAGLFTVQQSDVFIAVWDGQPARGAGGTAELVGFALEQGRALSHIWAGNHSSCNATHTDVGPKHGQVRYRDFPGQPRGVWSEEPPDLIAGDYWCP